MDRLGALAQTQRALLEKIQALDQQELDDEQGVIEEDASQPPPSTADTQDVISMLMEKQRELQRMRSAITELQQLQHGVQTLLRGQPTQEEPPAAAQDPEEQVLLAGLLRKREELQRMQGNGPEAEARSPGSDDDEADLEAEEREKEELLATLMSKHRELERMRNSISELQHLRDEQVEQAAAQYERQRPTENEDDGEPKTEEEWIAKLMKQQAELSELRAAIVAEDARGVAEEPSATDVDEPEEETDQAMLSALAAKREELRSLMLAKQQLERQLAMQEAEQEHEEEDISEMPPADTQVGAKEDVTELLAILQRRRQAQQAVEEQERKISELTALQETLRMRLNEFPEQRDSQQEEEEEGAEETEFEEEEEVSNADANEGGAVEGMAEHELGQMQERVLQLLALKTKECDELATAVERARESGISGDDPRLLHAEETLAQRYEEVKEIAEMAHRLGIAGGEDGEDGEELVEDAESEDDHVALEAEATAAFTNVQRLEEHLAACLNDLRAIEASSSEQVARHPAYRKLKSEVKAQLVSLKSQLEDARAAHADVQGRIEAARQVEEEGEYDLEPIMQAAINKLWARPYKCRVFTLKLLSSLAELDDDSLVMMGSCFSKYLDDNAVPVS